MKGYGDFGESKHGFESSGYGESRHKHKDEHSSRRSGEDDDDCERFERKYGVGETYGVEKMKVKDDSDSDGSDDHRGHKQHKKQYANY